MDYIIEENGRAAHWFIRANEGICRRALRSDGSGEKRCVLAGNYTAFGIYPDKENVHIVATDYSGEIVYLKLGGENEKIILTKVPDGAKITKMSLYPVRGRLNMIFCMSRGGEDYLMHCILGNNALPHTVSKLAGADYFIGGMRVFYVRPDATVGFSELADERPDLFVRVAAKASVPYVFDGHIVYSSCGRIYFDNREIFAGEQIYSPIITSAGGKNFVLWQSGGSVYYLPADGSEKKPNAVINPAAEPKLFEVISGSGRKYCYGACPGERVVFYVNTSPLEKEQRDSTHTLKKRMLEMKREIDELRAELAEYGK